MEENTTFDKIYKLFLGSIQDYKIKNIFIDDFSVGDDMLDTFLTKSIPKFYNCTKDISNVDFTNRTLDVALDIYELNILVDCMVLTWMNWSINNITQMEITLDDNDYKHYSEERNLSGKTNHRNMMREILDQDMLAYGLRHTPFKDWADGNYGL